MATISQSVPVHVDVEAQELAEPRPHVLRAALRVERAAAVAEAEVEQAVRAERELAAVVVLVGLVDGQQLAHSLGAALGRPVFGDARVAVQVRVVDVEPRVVREPGVKREREQPLLAAGGHLGRDVQQRLGSSAEPRRTRTVPSCSTT